MKLISTLIAAGFISASLAACISDGGDYDRYAGGRDYCDGIRTSGGTCIPETRRAPTTPN